MGGGVAKNWAKWESCQASRVYCIGMRPSRPVTDLIPGDPTARCPQGKGREAGEGKAGERKTPAYFVSEMVNTDPKEPVSVPLNS